MISKEHFDFEYSSDDEEFNDKEKYPDFGLKEYWDNRYKIDKKPYDWYFEWSRISPLLKKYIKDKSDVLVIGCGNSTMSYDLISDGFKNVISIDISAVVIKQMQQTYKKQRKLKWQVMDASALDFFDNSFDIVFDKGTIDAIICHPNGAEKVSQTLKEVFRVLKTNGKFVVITFESPAKRLKTLRLVKLNWNLLPPLNLHLSDEKNSTMIYVYILEKN